MFVLTTLLIVFVPLIMAYVMSLVNDAYRRDSRPSKMGLLLAQSVVVLTSVAVWAAAGWELHLTYV